MSIAIGGEILPEERGIPAKALVEINDTLQRVHQLFTQVQKLNDGLNATNALISMPDTSASFKERMAGTARELADNLEKTRGRLEEAAAQVRAYMQNHEEVREHVQKQLPKELSQLFSSFIPTTAEKTRRKRTGEQVQGGPQSYMDKRRRVVQKPGSAGGAPAAVVTAAAQSIPTEQGVSHKRSATGEALAPPRAGKHQATAAEVKPLSRWETRVHMLRQGSRRPGARPLPSVKRGLALGLVRRPAPNTLRRSAIPRATRQHSAVVGVGVSGASAQVAGVQELRGTMVPQGKEALPELGRFVRVRFETKSRPPVEGYVWIPEAAGERYQSKITISDPRWVDVTVKLPESGWTAGQFVAAAASIGSLETPRPQAVVAGGSSVPASAKTFGQRTAGAVSKASGTASWVFSDVIGLPALGLLAGPILEAVAKHGVEGLGRARPEVSTALAVTAAVGLVGGWALKGVSKRLKRSPTPQFAAVIKLPKAMPQVIT